MEQQNQTQRIQQFFVDRSPTEFSIPIEFIIGTSFIDRTTSTYHQFSNPFINCEGHFSHRLSTDARRWSFLFWGVEWRTVCVV